MSIQDDLRDENAEIEADEHAGDKEDNGFADAGRQEAVDALRAISGVPREVIEADRARKPRRTAAEREQAAIAKAESKLEALRAKERIRRLREAHSHIEQAMVYLQLGDASVPLVDDGNGTAVSFDISDVLVDIRAALRGEIGE